MYRIQEECIGYKNQSRSFGSFYMEKKERNNG